MKKKFKKDWWKKKNEKLWKARNAITDFVYNYADTKLTTIIFAYVVLL